jgi:hypothetical protein
MRWKLLIGASVVLLAGACVFYSLSGLPFDSRRVEPRLLSLAKPYRSVDVDRFKDGGSIAIWIVDRDGRIEIFAIPWHMGGSEHNGKVFVGASSDRSPKAVEVQDSDQTKRMLIHVLASKSHRTVHEDYCLAELSHRLDHGIRSSVHSWIDDYF